MRAVGGIGYSEEERCLSPPPPRTYRTRIKSEPKVVESSPLIKLQVRLFLFLFLHFFWAQASFFAKKPNKP